MRLPLLLAFCGLFLGSCANAPLNKLYRQHKQQPEATKFKLPAVVIRMGGLAAFSGLPTAVRKQNRGLWRKLGKLRFIQAPLNEDYDFAKMYGKLRQSGIEDLVFVRDKETRVQVAIRERNGKIRDVILLIEDGDDLIYFHIRSRLKIEHIQKLIRVIQQTEEGKKLPLPPVA